MLSSENTELSKNAPQLHKLCPQRVDADTGMQEVSWGMMPLKGQKRREEGSAGKVSDQGTDPASGKDDAGLGSNSNEVPADRTRGSRANVTWQRNLVQGRKAQASDPTCSLGWVGLPKKSMALAKACPEGVNNWNCLLNHS